jgi:LemA protein
MELNKPLIATLLVMAVLLAWIVGAYNRLVALRSGIGAAWAQVEEPLKQRHELLSQLVTALREPLQREHAALDGVLAASAQAHAASNAVRPRPIEARAVASLVLAEQVLASAWARLAGVLEGQAELCRSEGIAACLVEFQAIEQRLSFRRQLFNQATHTYNEAVRQFPTSLLTPFFRFQLAGRL